MLLLEAAEPVIELEVNLPTGGAFITGLFVLALIGPLAWVTWALRGGD